MSFVHPIAAPVVQDTMDTVTILNIADLMNVNALYIIQLMTFDKVDAMIYQPRRSDNYRDQRSR